MDQLTFEFLGDPEEEDQAPVIVAPQAIDKLIHLMTAAIVAVFEGGSQE